ncbi:hypothetical protein GLAREA_05838 [Glarea lozoyensis ATCC 20868]|uniref:Uncharacterized protein n=1 Tax=Glarea lozoyensis (strain ATCC 20868 / MF5171) TaxID=1116229 RepID=S3DLC8_GLAL2|nr:uncharacterized protein GLAREA_05838 [Glarea lozoyensis ATCC 20868]EPE32826.1 hypothetical protein GLAREA_05838 [Glarea lozoyensis ATCC 20868]
MATKQQEKSQKSCTRLIPEPATSDIGLYLDPGTDTDDYEDYEMPPQAQVPQPTVPGRSSYEGQTNHSRNTPLEPDFLAEVHRPPRVFQKAIEFWESLSPGRSRPPVPIPEQRPKRKHRSEDPRQLERDRLNREASNSNSTNIAVAPRTGSSHKSEQATQTRGGQWQAYGKSLQDQLAQAQRENQNLEDYAEKLKTEAVNNRHTFEKEIRKIESEKQRVDAERKQIENEKTKIEAEYQSFILQKLKESSEKEDSAQWQRDGNQDIADLEKLKKDMRTLARNMAIKDPISLRNLSEEDHTALMGSLSEVCVLRNRTIPEELMTPKSPALLLNALLAHDIFTNLFRKPFFFVETGLQEDIPEYRMDTILNDIYKRMLQGKAVDLVPQEVVAKRTLANRETPHLWRAQMLRILKDDSKTNPQDKSAKANSEENRSIVPLDSLISRVSSLKSDAFLASPARHLLTPSPKIAALYNRAAHIAYTLWMRKSHVVLYTLKELESPKFDGNSRVLVPHSSVRWEEVEGGLLGREVGLIVHPLVRVFGVGEGGEREGAVWAPGEVWVDSPKVEMKE